MAEFALLNFAEGETAVPGIKVGEHVLPVAAALEATGKAGPFPPSSTKEILSHWQKAEPVLGAIADAFAGKRQTGCAPSQNRSPRCGSWRRFFIPTRSSARSRITPTT